MKNAPSLSSATAQAQPASSAAADDTSSAREGAATLAGPGRLSAARVLPQVGNVRVDALPRPGLIAPWANTPLEALRELAGRFVDTLPRLTGLAWTGDVGATGTRPASPERAGAMASSAALIATIRQAVSMPEPARVTVLGMVAISLPQQCVSPQTALTALEHLRSAIGTIDTPMLRYRAIMQLGEQFTDPRFGELAATAGAEAFFHRFNDDLIAASHVIAFLPDVHAQAGRFGRIQERTLELATWSGLMAPIEAVAVAERAPLLEKFSYLLTQLQSLEQRTRGVECLLEKVPHLPLPSQIVIIDNVTKLMRECVPPAERLQTLIQIVERVARFPGGVRSRLLGQLATNLAGVPAEQRQPAFDLLLGHARQLGPAFSPEYLYRLANTITSLPQAPARQAAWMVIAETLNTLPQVARAQPIIGLIDNIGALDDAPTCIDFLARFGPNLVDLPPPTRYKALLHMIDAVQRLPSGPTRALALQQTTLLMDMRDTGAQYGVMQLAALTGMLHYLESTSECLNVLQTVIHKARALPDAARIEVLESLTREFRGWQNLDLLKPAVMMISLECQPALPATRDRLALAVSAGLSAVGRDLQAELLTRKPDALPVAAIESWFQAAAIAPAPGRTHLLQAADELVASGTRRDQWLGQGLLEVYGRHFPQAMHAALAFRLASMTS